MGHSKRLFEDEQNRQEDEKDVNFVIRKTQQSYGNVDYNIQTLLPLPAEFDSELYQLVNKYTKTKKT